MLSEIIRYKGKERRKISSNRNLFRKTFSRKKGKIIAEIKPKKPGENTLHNAETIAKEILKYNDISGFSILIDHNYFWGNIGNIELIRSAKKPTLFKEFIIEESQIDGAHYFWYDAVLLMKKILPLDKLSHLVSYCHTKNIEPFVEIDNTEDLTEIIESFSPDDITIGINCRNLDTMEINRERHFSLYDKKLKQYIVIALSGITHLEQVREYVWIYNGVLIWSLFLPLKEFK